MRLEHSLMEVNTTANTQGGWLDTNNDNQHTLKSLLCVIHACIESASTNHVVNMRQLANVALSVNVDQETASFMHANAGFVEEEVGATA